MVDDDPGGWLPPSPEDRGVSLLASYVAGTATPDERARVEERARDDPRLAAVLEELTVAWEGARQAFDVVITEADVDRAWARLDKGRLQASVPARFGRSKGSTRTKPRTTIRRPWRRAAVSVLILVGISIGIDFRSTGNMESVGSVHGWQPEELESPVGRRTAFTLSDGSEVLLGPGSRLVVEESEGDARVVSLSGRGFFTVAPDAERPFVVRTAIATVEVLGTQFSVRAYPEGQTDEVVVQSGKVAVSDLAVRTERQNVLIAGDRGMIGEDGSVVVESNVDLDALLAWRSGGLAFRRTPLREAVIELSHEHDLQITIEDSAIGDRRITATFRTEPLDVVLQTLAELTLSEVRRNGRLVTFSPPTAHR